MIFAKVDVELRDHDKAHRAGRAMATWTWALLWTRSKERDGFVAASALRGAWVGERQALRDMGSLVEADLVTVVDGGWLVVGYAEKNETRNQIDERRADGRERKRRHDEKKRTFKTAKTSEKSSELTRYEAVHNATEPEPESDPEYPPKPPTSVERAEQPAAGEGGIHAAEVEPEVAQSTARLTGQPLSGTGAPSAEQGALATRADSEVANAFAGQSRPSPEVELEAVGMRADPSVEGMLQTALREAKSAKRVDPWAWKEISTAFNAWLPDMPAAGRPAAVLAWARRWVADPQTDLASVRIPHKIFLAWCNTQEGLGVEKPFVPYHQLAELPPARDPEHERRCFEVALPQFEALMRQLEEAS